jgi:hypothetical protein
LSKRRVKDGSSDATGRSFPKGKNPGRNPTPGDDEPAPERAGESNTWQEDRSVDA